MSTARLFILCGVIVLTAAAQSVADEVDDLLAGKPIVVQQAAAAERPDGVLLEDSLVAPVEASPLAEEMPWDATIGHQAPTSVAEESPAASREREDEPAPGVNLVPEPSAFVLATIALLYFVIFFRRRHFS